MTWSQFKEALERAGPRKAFRLKWRALAISIGAVFAFLSSWQLNINELFIASICALIALLAVLYELVIADIVADKQFPRGTERLFQELENRHSELENRLFVTIREAIRQLQGCDTSRVSGTFHFVAECLPALGTRPDDILIQLIRYTGQGGRKWRITRASEGIIGRCLRTQESEWVNFSSDADFRYRMVREFGFRKGTLSEHTQTSRSYWAEPVFVEGQLVGVVFLHTPEAQAFPHSVNREVLRAAATEIGAYLQGAKLTSYSFESAAG